MAVLTAWLSSNEQSVSVTKPPVEVIAFPCQAMERDM
jgi:hypothetical protein